MGEPVIERASSLGEGRTPLVPSVRIGPNAGLTSLFFKVETGNPTGSYKDRFAAAAVAEHVRRGVRRCIATSSGNTGAALAAYCARAGIACEVAIVEPAPDHKLRQMAAYGARLYRVRGFGLDAEVTGRTMDLLRRRGAEPRTAFEVSAFCISPVGMAGVCAIATELVEHPPAFDHVFCPAGGGGLTLAVARGLGGRGPRIECVQPEGNDTIAGPLRDGADRARPVECRTAVSGLQVPSVLDGDEVIAACRRSGGTGHVVADDCILDAQARLAREEGIYAEPAGAAALAGVLAAASAGRIDPAARIACLVTGAAFKVPSAIVRMTDPLACPTVDPASLGPGSTR